MDVLYGFELILTTKANWILGIQKKLSLLSKMSLFI